MKYIAYLLIFLCELVTWLALAALGFMISDQTMWQWITSIVIFIFVTVMWAIFMSPKSKYRLSKTHYYIVKLLIYLGAAVILWQYNWRLAIPFMTVAIISDLMVINNSKRSTA